MRRIQKNELSRGERWEMIFSCRVFLG